MADIAAKPTQETLTSGLGSEPAVTTSRKLGRLVRVDAREIWQHEAHHFTPWLSQNIERLSEALGVELEIEVCSDLCSSGGGTRRDSAGRRGSERARSTLFVRV